MDELISRKQAIDALRGYLVEKRCPDDGTLTCRLIENEVINKLPPAQPEIIRCKDCKHFEYDHPYIIQGIPVLGHEVCNAWGDGCKTDENGYCFMAERRTDEQTD